MAENISSQFHRVFAFPIETNRSVNTILERDSIPSGVRWEGMHVYVTQVGEQKTYELRGGIGNENWEPISDINFDVAIDIAFSTTSNNPLRNSTITNGMYQRSQLQTSGQAEVHWDNLTNVPGGIESPTLQFVTENENTTNQGVVITGLASLEFEGLGGAGTRSALYTTEDNALIAEPNNGIFNVIGNARSTEDPVLQNDLVRLSYLQGNYQDVSDKVNNIFPGSTTEYPTTQAVVDALVANNTFLNVKNFGAVGDGVTDDTQAIIDAIDEMKTSDFGRLYFPEGVYMISGTIYIPGDVEIFGDGKDKSILRNLPTANLDIVIPFGEVFDGCNTAACDRYKYLPMMATETSPLSNKNFVQNIIIRNMGFDWNSVNCGPNSALPILMAKVRNSIVSDVHIFDALPADLDNGAPVNRGRSILFAGAFDCALRNSTINAADYESVSVWYGSQNIWVHNNTFDVNKPDTYSSQNHIMQMAGPRLAGADIIADLGHFQAGPCFIYANSFRMRQGVAHAFTIHGQKGAYLYNNYVKAYPENRTAWGFKPLDGASDVVMSGNVIDFSEAMDNVSSGGFPNGVNALAISSDSPPPAHMDCENIIITDNIVYANQRLETEKSLIGGDISIANNVTISGNIIHILEYNNYELKAIAYNGDNVTISDNKVVYGTPLESIDGNGPVFISGKGAGVASITGNTSTGSDIGMGIRPDTEDTAHNIIVSNNIIDNAISTKVDIGDNTYVSPLTVSGIKANENGDIAGIASTQYVNSFGIGTRWSTERPDDFNDLLNGGLYWTTTNPENGPTPSLNSSYSVLHIGLDSSAGWATQLAMRDTPSTGLRWRGLENGVWQGWKDIWHSGNLNPGDFLTSPGTLQQTTEQGNITDRRLRLTGNSGTTSGDGLHLYLHPGLDEAYIEKRVGGNVAGQLNIRNDNTTLLGGGVGVNSQLQLKAEDASNAGAEFNTRIKASPAENPDEVLTGENAGFGLSWNGTDDALDWGEYDSGSNRHFINLDYIGAAGAFSIGDATDPDAGLIHTQKSDAGGTTATTIRGYNVGGRQTTIIGSTSAAIGAQMTMSATNSGTTNNLSIRNPANSNGAVAEISGGSLTIDQAGEGFIMKSPNGTSWKVTIDNSGNIITTQL